MTDGGRHGLGGVLLRLLAGTEWALNLAAAGAILVVMALVNLQIVARYVFNRAVPGIYESAELLMVGMVFLGLAYIQSRNGHIHVEILVRRLSGSPRNLLEVATLLLPLAVFAIVTFKSGQKAYLAWQMGDVTMGLIDFPTWPSKMLVPIGTGLLCLHFIAQLAGRFIRRQVASRYE